MMVYCKRCNGIQGNIFSEYKKSQVRKKKKKFKVDYEKQFFSIGQGNHDILTRQKIRHIPTKLLPTSPVLS